MKKISYDGSAGFTIVELMIALSVLSVLLIICTVTLLNLGKMYVKGNNQANVQEIARNVMDDISNQLRLGGAAPAFSTTDTPGFICIGAVRYSYLLGRQVSAPPVDASAAVLQTQHALWRDTLTSGGSCPDTFVPLMQDSNPTKNSALSVPGSGQELIPEHMRLSRFSITPLPSGLYRIEVGVTYGDNDLVCASGANLGGGDDCSEQKIAADTAGHHIGNIINASNDPAGNNVRCVSSEGQQFCSTSDLEVIVARRLTNS
ncbi:MAG: prepilin-type N-terminal cleavage/methylation domain-containing protein [Candidatus Saccharimonadales bacterium]